MRQQSRFLILVVILGLAWLPIAQAQQSDAVMVEDHAAEDLERLRDRSEKGDVAAPELTVLDGIQRLLARAEMQILHLALTTPEGDSAFDTYHQILFLQPNHEAALAGIQQIGIKYVDLANLAVARGDFQRARSYAAKASEFAPEHPIVQALVIPPEAVPFNEQKTLTAVTLADNKATQQTSIEMGEVTEDSERLIAPAPSVAQRSSTEDSGELITAIGFAPSQLHQPEQELERLRTLFREIIEQTEARIQQQSEAVAASNAEAARLSEELAKAQQEIGRLTAALNEAETAGTEIDRARAEAEARIEQQAEAIAASNAETTQLSEELAAARQQMNELKSGLANTQSTLKELDTEFDALSDAIVKRIEQLFVAATLQSVADIGQLRAKIGATTEQIDKLGESFRDAKGGELGSDDLAEFSTGVEPDLIIGTSQAEN